MLPYTLDVRVSLKGVGLSRLSRFSPLPATDVAASQTRLPVLASGVCSDEESNLATRPLSPTCLPLTLSEHKLCVTSPYLGVTTQFLFALIAAAFQASGT